jgi:uncharacterized repeat protein (TIGR01451 family)
LEVAFTNAILPGFTLVRATSSAGSPATNGGLVTCSFGNLANNAWATISVVVIPNNVGTFTNIASASTRSSDTNLANNVGSSPFSVVGLAPNIVAASSQLTSESGPANGAIDFGETVTVALALRNDGSADATNVSATLQNSGGVTPNGPNQKSYGRLNKGGSTGTNTFSFTANGTNGGVVVATLLVSDSGNSLGAVTFAFGLPSTAVFSNTAAITIPDHGAATPYPSTISVAGLTGAVSKVRVSLNALSHSFPRDVHALLTGPDGGKTLLISHAGGAQPVTNINLTFDDAAAANLPNGTQLSSGTFKPSAYGMVTLPAPAPASPYPATLSAQNGKAPNGTWSLFVFDDSNGDGGSIAGGWNLEITTASAINALADLAVTISSTPATVFVGTRITNIITVTNIGPSTANSVAVSHSLALGALFVSASSSQGTVTGPVAGVITGDLGSLAVGTGAQLSIVEVPTLAGTMFNIATVSGAEVDLNGANNSAQFNANVFSPAGARLTASLNGGLVEITVTGEPNMSYILQASTDLSSWTSVSTNTATGGTFKYVDPNSQTISHRFYRAVRQLP